MELKKYLIKTGLTEAEALIFQTLLSTGQTTTGEIIKRTNLQSSTVYHCLDSLINKGIVSFIVKNNMKHFQAEPADYFINYIKTQQEELSEAEKNITTLISQVKLKSETKEEFAKIFSGWRGIRTAFAEAITSLNEKEIIYVFTLSTYAGADKDKVRSLINYIRDLRLNKKIYEKVIINESEKISLGKEHEKVKYTEVKYLPQNLAHPAIVHIYNDITLSAVSSEPPIAFLIKNKTMSESFKNYFKLLWKIAKK